jgi:hypothetical protein
MTYKTHPVFLVIGIGFTILGLAIAFDSAQVPGPHPIDSFMHKFTADEISLIKARTEHLDGRVLPLGKTRGAIIDELFLHPWSVDALIARRDAEDKIMKTCASTIFAPGQSLEAARGLGPIIRTANECHLISDAIDVAIGILRGEIGDQ